MSGIALLFRLLETGIQMNADSKEELVSLCLRQMENYARKYTDFSRYSIFSDQHYTRNLVDQSDLIEMIVICWGPGQESRIHNHDKSNCFMVALQGEVVEKRYTKASSSVELDQRSDSTDNADTDCPELLLLSQTKLIRGGSAVHIDDSLGLHSVGNYSSEPAVTLHVYSPPILRVKVFEPDRNVVQIRLPGFYSLHGRKTGKA